MKSNTATATTATAKSPEYVGRFAPSPSGDLHLGSLLTAVASYLDARANAGRWLLRLEDLDRDRELAGSASSILHSLESFGLLWDGPVVRQSARGPLYEDALQRLGDARRLFACACSRRQLRDEQRYPGTCRRTTPAAGVAIALRFKVDPEHIEFHDRIQGLMLQDPAAGNGDLIVKRRDGVIAYALAVVVDDAAQGVTHIVRGADLLEHTAGQILLQRALGRPQPTYAHVPVLTQADGGKLAKSRRSGAIASERRMAQLCAIAALLGMQPPVDLAQQGITDFWKWAISRWDVKKVPCQPVLAQA